MMRRLLSIACAALCVGSAGSVHAQTALPQGGDPRIPDALRQQAPQKSPRGEALDRVVQKKLRARFNAVDASGTGLVTREQALASKWPVLAQHFDEIDTGKRGAVNFEDVMRYLRTRQASR